MEVMTSFYGNVLGLPRVESLDDCDIFVSFDVGAAHLALHRIPDEIARDIEISDPPQARQETATGLRDQARRYVTIKNSIPNLRAKIKNMKRTNSQDKSLLESDERDMSEVIPPHIIDNVATLYRIL